LSKIIIDHNNIEIKKWYDLRNVISKLNGFPSSEDFTNLLSDSIKIRLRSDVPVGVCLSGGLDSSSILSLMLNDNKNDINTFSAVYGDGQKGDESTFINEYKEAVNNMFFAKPTAKTLMKDLSKFIKANEEPIPDTSPYAQFKVMEMAKNKVVVLLNGQGADEQLAGYHYFFGFHFKQLLKRFQIYHLFKEILEYLLLHKSFFGLKSFFYILLPNQMQSFLMLSSKGYLINDFTKEYKVGTQNANSIFSSKDLRFITIIRTCSHEGHKFSKQSTPCPYTHMLYV